MSYDQFLRRRLTLNPDLGRECCNDVHNLKYAFAENNRRDAITLRCKVCGRRHFRRFAEVGSYFREHK